MRARKIIASAIGLLGLMLAADSSAITFVVSKDFPKHFYCHFRADGWVYKTCVTGCLYPQEFYEEGGWSSRRHAGATYHAHWPGLVKVLASCFDDQANENILPTGHICYSINKNDPDTTVTITHRGHQILFNGEYPKGNGHC